MYINVCFYVDYLLTVTTIPDPEFVDEIGNITVPAGRNVKLACSVKDLGSFKVCTRMNNIMFCYTIIHLYVFLFLLI